MTVDELKDRKAGKEPSRIPIKDFIINRGKELFEVPISGPDGYTYIEIRARLTKKEINEHKVFLEMFKDPENVSEDMAEQVAAKFLAAITTDDTLDEAFWMSDDIDPYIAQELIMAFLRKAASTLEGVKKFR